jgi:hypothetical protein
MTPAEARRRPVRPRSAPSQAASTQGLRPGPTRALSALLGGEPLLHEAGGHALVQAARRLVTRSADELLTELHLLRFAETALAQDFAVADRRNKR